MKSAGRRSSRHRQSLPWFIAALCFGWATFATFLMMRDDGTSAPSGTSISTLAREDMSAMVRAEVRAAMHREGGGAGAEAGAATETAVDRDPVGSGARSEEPRPEAAASRPRSGSGARPRRGGLLPWGKKHAPERGSSRPKGPGGSNNGGSVLPRRPGEVSSSAEERDVVDDSGSDSGRSSSPGERASNSDGSALDSASDSMTPEERFLRSTDPLPRSVYGRLNQLTPMPGFPHTPPVVLSAKHPKAYLFRNFLSAEETAHLVEQAKLQLAPSTVVGQSGPVASGIRTSAGMFLNKGQTPMLRAIEERMAAAAGIPEPNGEGMQILRYEKGQKYDPHYDYFHDAVNSSPKRGGQRMATMLVYLRDTELGGETIFPKAKKPPDFDDPDAGEFRWSQCAQVGGVPVRSVAGDAVLFWSLTEANTLDPGSLHGACPVVAGEKWTAVKWMRVAKFDGNFQHELPMPSLTVADRSSDDPEKNCVDEWAECAEWARKGWCARNPEFMIGRAGSRDSKGGACPKSCDVKC